MVSFWFRLFNQQFVDERTADWARLQGYYHCERQKSHPIALDIQDNLLIFASGTKKLISKDYAGNQYQETCHRCRHR